MKTFAPKYTVPGMSVQNAGGVIQLLSLRLHALNDLALTLKHVHWNVVGPHFIAVHEMLDPQVEAVRGMVDETAERISTLEESPTELRARWWPSGAGTITTWAGQGPSIISERSISCTRV